jgi:hypothetical protein
MKRESSRRSSRGRSEILARYQHDYGSPGNNFQTKKPT